MVVLVRQIHIRDRLPGQILEQQMAKSIPRGQAFADGDALQRLGLPVGSRRGISTHRLHHGRNRLYYLRDACTLACSSKDRL